MELINTNATGTYHARIALDGLTGLASLGVLRLGIDNGTATDQIIVLSGVI